MDVYKKIDQAGLNMDVHLGRLLGVVHQEQDDTILGLLLRYIDHKYTLELAMHEDVSSDLRQRWGEQIRRALAALHEVGAVWGDAKAENVLIDSEDNAWITDFEGGYTRGWVDADKAGTMEGDLQGLDRIIKFLDEGPRHRHSMECENSRDKTP